MNRSFLVALVVACVAVSTVAQTPSSDDIAQRAIERRAVEAVIHETADGRKLWVWVESLSALVEHADGRLEIIDWAQREAALKAPSGLALTLAG